MEPPQLLLAATRQTTRLILHPFLGKVPSLLLFLWVTAVVVISCTTTGDGTKLQWSVQAFTCHHRTAIPQLLQQQRSRLFSSSRQRMPWFLSHVHYEHDLQSKMMTRPATITTRRRTNHPFSRLLLVLPNAASPRDNDTTASTQTTTTPPLPDTTDPYQILNIFPTADRKEIKRAYRRMALLYHPDVRTNGNSTEQERKDANDDFARINTAYAFLMGKGEEQPSRGGSSRGGSSGSSGSGRYGGYTPPHRRTATSSTGSSSSVDWQDFMPKYDAEEYDAGGDSFASIFADLLSGIGSASASASAAGSSSAGGILNDLISFLEGNFPSVGKYQQTQEDVILKSLLRDGSMEEIKDELDDAKLLVRQLEQKQMDLDLELQAVNVERQRMTENQKDGMGGGKSNTYMEDMRLEEKKRELEVRKDVVGEYLERARMRQLRLRKRIEELKMMRDDYYNDDFAKSTRQRGSGSGGGSYSTGNGSFPRDKCNNANVGSGSGSSSGSGTRDNSQEGSSEDEPSWKTEGFGTSRRRRRSSSRSRPSSSSSSRSTAFSEDSGVGGSSRSRSTTSTTTTGSGSSRSNTYGNATTGPTTSSSSSSSSWQNTSTGTSTRTTASNNTYYRNNNVVGKEQSVVPPHRRLTSRYEQVQQDKKRLREIKVDEEIEKMKKELGLN